MLLADFNGDHHLDMLIGAEPNGSTKCDGDSELFAAFGVGDGTFHSDLSTLPLADGDGNAISLGNTLVCSMPLAVGNLNDDAAIDLVMGSQILVSDPDSQASGPLGGATYTIATVNFEGKWTSAVVADLNANGIPDVATATQGSNTIDFYNGVGDGRLNRFQVQARGEPSELTVGDFDGDLVNDLAFKERGPHGNVGAGVETGDSLSIAFGNGFGGPSEPVSMGRLARIDRVVSGNVEELFSDGIADLLVLSTSENSDSRSIALLTGSSDRQLVSPFFLASDGSTLPVRAVIGEFTGDDHNDVAVLASSTESFETSTFTNRVWILPSTGEAAIDSADVFSSEPVETLESGENALTAALDLDGDGVDELIAFVSGTSDSGAVMIIGHVVDGGFQLEEPQFTDESYFFDPLGNVTGGPDPGVPDPLRCPANRRPREPTWSTTARFWFGTSMGMAARTSLRLASRRQAMTESRSPRSCSTRTRATAPSTCPSAWCSRTLQTSTLAPSRSPKATPTPPPRWCCSAPRAAGLPTSTSARRSW